VEFVERETGYRLDPLPRIIVDRERMSKDWSGSASVFAYVPQASFSAFSGEPIVYLDHTRYMPGTSQWNAAIVHELVHYGQYLTYMAAVRAGPAAVTELRSRKGWVCTRSTEIEATNAEIRYLRNHDPVYARRMEAVNLAEYSACVSGYKPTLFGRP